MSSIFNLEHWPVVLLSTDNNELNDESFDNYKRNYINLLLKCKNEGTKIILICSLNTNGNIPIKYIAKQSEFNKEMYNYNKEYVKCVCILCKEKSFKNILNLYFTMAKPATPYKLCRSIEKVNKYLNEVMKINFNANVYNIANNECLEEEENNYKENNNYNEIINK